jgi:hypothetical protein
MKPALTEYSEADLLSHHMDINELLAGFTTYPS